MGDTGMPDCSTSTCSSVCSCVESKCANLYDDCVADTQCSGILTCMLGCACDDTVCALGCVAGSTLDAISTEVKTCGSGCLSTVVRFMQSRFWSGLGLFAISA